MSDAEKFAAVLAENFRGVRYDEKKGTGTATIPNVGWIEFHESAVDFLEKLQDAWRNSD